MVDVRALRYTEGVNRDVKVVVVVSGPSAVGPYWEDDQDCDTFVLTAPPDVDEIVAADITLVVGALGDGERTAALGGRLRLALDRGALVVFAYDVRPSVPELLLLTEWLGVTPFVGHSPGAVAVEPGSKEAFSEYFTRYGRSAFGFALPSGNDAEPLCRARIDNSIHMSGFAAPVGAGTLYVVPFHTVDDGWYGEHLVRSVLAHRAGAAGQDPEFFNDVQLPGELNLRASLVEAREQVEAIERSVANLVAHKRVIGHLSGDALKRAVADELNMLLADSGVAALDSDDGFVQDIELRRGENLVGVGEVKGIRGGIGLGDVNQVNGHRTRLELAVTDAPGLLIVNTFRNDESLSRRQESVPAQIVGHAAALNVLVMRTWDLFEMVRRRLAGDDDAQALLDAISGGGGWLEGTADGMKHHRPS